MGDPAGIGPEITAAAAASPAVRRACTLTVFGDPGVFESACAAAGVAADSATAIREIRPVSTLKFSGVLPKPAKRCGEAAFRYLEAAVGAVMAAECDGLVTAPLNKLWMNRAGHAYDGHTGYLSEAAGQTAVMMLAGKHLRVVPVTTHIALADVPRRLQADDIVHAGRVLSTHLRRFLGIERPRVAVAALNPHAGEGGLFGDEEARIIAPAVRRLRRAKVAAEGPLAADGLFAGGAASQYDGVLCMYHDQALIPLKLAEFGRSVNVSMGLPFIRTSPDHGTAYDLAGTGRASSESMVASTLLAATMCRIAAD